ncbi:MAG: PAS domain-containing protein, partial [Candidatus Marinimicrobia bacterium]|nr:PAS domain-containing protein [Candidatus Neomarinimicrobiota bacterium]
MPESQKDHQQLLAYAEDLAKIYESEKQKRTQLEIENQKLRLTIDGLTDAVVTLDPQLQILEANQAFATLMGAELPHMAARPISEFISQTAWELIIEGIGDLTESDELEIDPAQDRKRFFRIFRKPLLDKRGRRHGSVIVIRDESQLRRAEIMKDEFLSIVSHEIRTPMNAILGFSNLLEKSLKNRLEDSELKYFELVRNGSQRLLNALQEIIDAAELATDIPQERSEFDLGGLVGAVQAKYQHQLQRKDITLSLSIPNEPSLGWGYPELMMKAVDHMIGNAVEFSPPNTDITVELTSNKKQWQLTVQDHGEGIPPERLENIFNSFYQAESYQTRSHEGLGLGLVIVKKTALLHGGNATVESEMGHGTTVTMTIRRHEERSPQDDAETVPGLQAELESLHAQNIQYAQDLAKTYKARKQAATQLAMTRDQLVRSDKLATMGQMAAGIAHEVNNMLTPIMGNVYMLRQQADGLAPEMERLLAGIDEATKRAADMLRQVLDFSRRGPEKSTPTDAVALLDKVLNLLEYRLRKGQVKVHKDYGPRPVAVMVNGKQIEQVIANLVINAIDAMPGGGELNISIREPSKPAKSTGGGTVEIRFSDTGSGIPEEIIESIFEPFFSTKPEGQGTGLGLGAEKGLKNR